MTNLIDAIPKTGFFSGQRNLWGLAGLLVILAILLGPSNAELAGRLERLKEEYETDLDLARHKEERLRTYESALKVSKLPPEKQIPVNEWIQRVHDAVTAQNLSLKDLKPLDRKGKTPPGLFLIVECRVSDLLNFLYHWAQSEDSIYVGKFSLSPTEDNPDRVRAQMTFFQSGG